MKSFSFAAVLVVLFMSVSFGSSWATCPQAPDDPGICDTFYINLYDSVNNDLGGASGFPRKIYLPMYTATDVPNPALDSVSAFVVPLSITHSNATAYCSISNYWNTSASFTNLTRSVWRNFPNPDSMLTNPNYRDTSHMLWLYLQEDENGPLGLEWNFSVFDLSSNVTIYKPGEVDSAVVPPHFFMSLVASSGDQFWSASSKRLLATLTLKVSDSMSIVIDTTFWPPSGQMTFASGGGLTKYVPRMPTLPCTLCVEHDTSFYGKCPWDTSSVEEFHQLPSLPDRFSLSQNFPNPFNPTTTIEFAIAKPEKVSLKVYNVLGKRVETLVDNRSLNPGTYQFNWNAAPYPSGIYFYQIETSDKIETRKMIFLK